MSIIEDLAAELGVNPDELRGELLDTSGDAEVLQPNYLTVDSAGRVGANFSGHISAQGLDLPDTHNAAPDGNSQIRWLAQNDGAVMAQVYDFSSDDNESSLIIQPRSRNAEKSSLQLGAIRNGVIGPFLELRYAADGTWGIFLSAAPALTLLDSAGKSDWDLWGAWTALPLNGTNWQNQVGGQPAQYRKTPTGSIQLRGDVQSKTVIALGFAATGLISALPAGGFVPLVDQVRIAPGTDPGAGNVIWGLDVTSGGSLYVFREHTGKPITLAAGVVVDIGLQYSIL